GSLRPFTVGTCRSRHRASSEDNETNVQLIQSPNRGCGRQAVDSAARCSQSSFKLFLEDRHLRLRTDTHANAAIEARRHRLSDEHIARDEFLNYFEREVTVLPAIDRHEIRSRGQGAQAVCFSNA